MRINLVRSIQTNMEQNIYQSVLMLVNKNTIQCLFMFLLLLCDIAVSDQGRDVC